MSAAQEMSWPDGNEPRGMGKRGTAMGWANQWRWPTASPSRFAAACEAKLWLIPSGSKMCVWM